MKPRDYQQEAIDSVVSEFKKNDRTTITMACGTGKTLVAMWIMEKMNSMRTIFIAPSLALISQTIESWSKATSFKKVKFAALCSEAKVYDDIELDDSFKGTVCKSKDELIEFYNNNKNYRLIVFSTYQSSGSIDASIEFDLAIYDEAHKTANHSERCFRKTLYDFNVSFHKRLFMTATPKCFIYGKAQDDVVEYSMDNQNIYGKICYVLSFDQAIKRNLICDYKILISIIDQSALKKQEDECSYVMSRDAQILSLLKTFKKYNIKRSVTFHRTIRQAMHFSRKMPDTCIKSLHINGQLPCHKRDEIMNLFKKTDYVNISNSRFLTEGVNIPSIDLVAFMTPKRSKIDIIQACGRAMRKSPGKSFGYIFLPLFVNKNDLSNLNNVIVESRYLYVWKIIKSLAEYDNSLNEEILNKRIKTGPGQNSSSKIIINTEDQSINIKDIENAIDVHLINSVISKWDLQYHNYKNFIKNFEKEPSEYSKNTDEVSLARWTRACRYNYNAQIMPKDQIEKLRAINFSFSPLTDKWHSKFEEFKNSILKKGFLPITNHGKSLEDWFYIQRLKINSNALRDNRAAMLKDFIKKYDPKLKILSIKKQNGWDLFVADIEEHRKKTGSYNLYKPKNPKIRKQIEYIRRNKDALSAQKLEYLEKINFDFRNFLQQKWEKKYDEIMHFLETYKQPQLMNSKAKNLKTWLDRQKYRFKNKELDKYHAKKISDLLKLIKGLNKPQKITLSDIFEAQLKER
jgi:superfamily II DNA or RNA helicase